MYIIEYKDLFQTTYLASKFDMFSPIPSLALKFKTNQEAVDVLHSLMLFEKYPMRFSVIAEI